MAGNICNYTPITSLSIKTLNDKFTAIHRYLCYVSGNISSGSFTGTTSAPSTSVGNTFTAFYGSSVSTVLATPNNWASVTIGGVAFKIPLYT